MGALGGAIGALVLARAWLGHAPSLVGSGRFRAIGFAGGTIEGIGGSWGPIVTTGLLGSGVPPRMAVGSSNVSEFVVSVVVFAVLTAGFHAGHWGSGMDWHQMIGSVSGLVVGGIPAAVFGGRLASRVPHLPLTVAVGCLAIGIAAYRFITM